MQPLGTEYITVAAAAQILTLTPHEVAALATSGALVATEVDGRLFVSHPAVLAYKEATR